MKPIQSLPNTYHQDRVVDLSKDKRLAIMLNMISVIVFLISGILFAGLASVLRGEAEFSITFDNIFLVLFGLVLVIILAPVVHEGIHGVCFWYFTRGKPQFGFRGFYAYAAAPDWYLPR
ncbi:MAG: hypothetical protein KDE51_06345, partial [Anaerolineales bacterium]|nr:hypothetical protein [Anaerolineales bacterium]